MCPDFGLIFFFHHRKPKQEERDIWDYEIPLLCLFHGPVLSFQAAVSVGNVGQLAVDLVVSTLGMSKAGYFYTDCLVPMIGNNPYATTEENAAELCMNAEGKSYRIVLTKCFLV